MFFIQDPYTMKTDVFALRHIGPRDEHTATKCLQVVGATPSLEALITAKPFLTTFDSSRPLNLDAPLSEQEYIEHIHHLASKNKVYKSYIGLGYHPSNLPAVIQRNILENPGWYTAYTPLPG